MAEIVLNWLIHAEVTIVYTFTKYKDTFFRHAFELFELKTFGLDIFLTALI